MLTHIGAYEVQGVIGDGGMGTVYRGRDPRFDRPVAIKVLHTQFQRDPQVVERFKNEAVIQAKLNHPNIVTVYDFLSTETTLAMVMEYIDGSPLDSWIETARGGLPAEFVVPVMGQVLSALGFAHAQGLVHRDVKASNVMVQEIGGEYVAKVMDFGIAKILGSEKMRTATSAKMGTLAYMSPEHLRSPKSVDARSDIYSLGVLLYEMTSGRAPFEGESEYELMRQILEEVPPPIEDLVPQLPGPYAGAIRRALEKEPARRFQSCGEMRAALTGGGSPIPGLRTSPTMPPAALSTGFSQLAAPTATAGSVFAPPRVPPPAAGALRAGGRGAERVPIDLENLSPHQLAIGASVGVAVLWLILWGVGGDVWRTSANEPRALFNLGVLGGALTGAVAGLRRLLEAKRSSWTSLLAPAAFGALAAGVVCGAAVGFLGRSGVAWGAIACLLGSVVLIQKAPPAGATTHWFWAGDQEGFPAPGLADRVQGSQAAFLASWFGAHAIAYFIQARYLPDKLESLIGAGVLVAIGQWMVLHRLASGPALWLPATAAGFWVADLLVVQGPLRALFQDVPLAFVWGCGAAALSQWFLLRGRIPRASLWLYSGFAMGGAFHLLVWVLHKARFGFPSAFLFYLAYAALFGLASLIPGFLFLHLARGKGTDGRAA